MYRRFKITLELETRSTTVHDTVEGLKALLLLGFRGSPLAAHFGVKSLDVQRFDEHGNLI